MVNGVRYVFGGSQYLQKQGVQGGLRFARKVTNIDQNNHAMGLFFEDFSRDRLQNCSSFLLCCLIWVDQNGAKPNLSMGLLQQQTLGSRPTFPNWCT